MSLLELVFEWFKGKIVIHRVRESVQMRQNVNKGKISLIVYLIKWFNLILEKSHKPIIYLFIQII